MQSPCFQNHWSNASRNVCQLASETPPKSDAGQNLTTGNPCSFSEVPVFAKLSYKTLQKDLVVHQQQPPGGTGISQVTLQKPSRDGWGPSCQNMEILSTLKWAKEVCGSRENHRIIEGGRDLCRLSGPVPLLKQVHLNPAAQDCVQRTLKYLQGRRLQSSVSHLCQCSVTLSVKQCFLLFIKSQKHFGWEGSLNHWNIIESNP